MTERYERSRSLIVATFTTGSESNQQLTDGIILRLQYPIVVVIHTVEFHPHDVSNQADSGAPVVFSDPPHRGGVRRLFEQGLRSIHDSMTSQIGSTCRRQVRASASARSTIS